MAILIGNPSPLELENNAAVYDITGEPSDTTYLLAGGLCPVVADQSGNSAVNGLVTNGGATNSLSAPNVSTTGNQTFSFDAAFADYTPASDRTLVNKLSGNDGFQILLLTTGVLRLRVGNGTDVTNVDSTEAVGITDLARGQFQIIWTDGVGAAYTKNGAPLGNAVPAVKTLTNAAVACVVDLTFAGVLYSFTCSTYTCNPSGAAKTYTTGAGNTFVAPTTGETWTITSTGARGARIGGARDHINLVVAEQARFLAPYAATGDILPDEAPINAPATRPWDTFNADSNNGFTAGVTNASAYKQCGWVNAVNIEVGKQYRVTFDLVVNSGTISAGYSVLVRQELAGTTSRSTFYPYVAGANSFVLTGLVADAAADLAFGAENGTTVNITVSNVTWSVVGSDINYAYLDGSNDEWATAPYALSQPLTRYTLFQHITWTSGDILWDGDAAGSSKLSQTGSTPDLQLNAGSAGPSRSTFVLREWAVCVEVINGASSALQRNKDAPVVADAGAGNPLGDQVGSDGDGANNANIAFAMRFLRLGIDSVALRSRIVGWMLRQAHLSA